MSVSAAVFTTFGDLSAVNALWPQIGSVEGLRYTLAMSLVSCECTVTTDRECGGAQIHPGRPCHWSAVNALWLQIGSVEGLRHTLAMSAVNYHTPHTNEDTQNELLIEVNKEQDLHFYLLQTQLPPPPTPFPLPPSYPLFLCPLITPPSSAPFPYCPSAPFLPLFLCPLPSALPLPPSSPLLVTWTVSPLCNVWFVTGHAAGISKKCVKLRPIAVIKG